MVNVQKDLSPRFRSVRDQGRRPTCLAFALSDVHAAERPPHDHLSVEYLFYHAVMRTLHKDPDQGLHLAAATSALSSQGQPSDTEWPYLPQLPLDRSGWKPPLSLATQSASASNHAPNLSVVCSLLDQDCPSVVIFAPTESFYRPDSNGHLNVSYNDPFLPQNHAVVALGYGEKSGSRYLFVRNSWGSNWGKDGHAWLSEEYLSPKILSVTSVCI
jgi:hypothetical protein